MYTLMNKNKPLIDFDFEISEVTGAEMPKVLKVYEQPWFVPNLGTWLNKRHAPKHRKHIESLMSKMGLTTTRLTIECTKGLSLTDTLWINQDDKFNWDTVNLFDNDFDEVISRIAFDGGMHGKAFSATSPEFTTDGAFAKCWVKIVEGIYLMKQGSSGASNAGMEPYSEYYCTEVLDLLKYKHVRYDICMFRGKLVSKCKLLTSKDTIMLPLAVCLDDYTLDGAVSYMKENSALVDFCNMLVLDYLVVNDDRHLNNVAMLFDAETYETLGMAPLYDQGGGLLPYAIQNNFSSKSKLDEYLLGKGPRFYDTFELGAKFAMKHVDSKPIRKLLQFKFQNRDCYGFPEWRLQALERMIQERAATLL